MIGRLGRVIAVGWLLAGALSTPTAGASSPRVFTLAGNGGYTIGATRAPRDGVLADRVQVDAPEDVALASDGSILYVDGITGAIRRVGVDGRVRTVVSGELDSPRRRGPTVEATAVATLPDGTVLIAEDGMVVRSAPAGPSRGSRATRRRETAVPRSRRACRAPDPWRPCPTAVF